MHQKWRDLLFLHWSVPAAQLRPVVPAELELDLFEGTAFVGLVAFTMRGIRAAGLPSFIGMSRFHETNLRTYVHRDGRDPGVWFLSLDAANPVAVVIARRWFHLPYHHARMLLEREPTRQAGKPETIVYAGVRRWPPPLPASYAIRATSCGSVEHARPGGLKHFLIERYIFYAAKDGRLVKGQVYHNPYPLQPAAVCSFDETLLAAAGLARPEESPLAHFARGVDARIFAVQSLPPR
jgi:uncharacterized protein YqjF (DUF2071 family)